MADFTFNLSPTASGDDSYVRALTEALAQAGHGVWFDEGPADAIQVFDATAIRNVAADRLAGAVGLIHSSVPASSDGEHDALRAAERERLPLLRRIVTSSQAGRDRLIEEFGIDPALLTVILPGVADLRRSPGSGGAECVIVSVGDVVPDAGYPVLLRALARLFDLPWRWVIVGDTAANEAHAAALRAQATTDCCGHRIRFAGMPDDAALKSLWQEADLFASATEGDDSFVLTALRRGLPVAVAGGSAAALVTPEIGVVCAPGDADGLSKAMRRVIFDQALRADMAEAAWQLGQTFPDWPRQAARFVEVAACS